jgi:hypothetical protein
MGLDTPMDNFEVGQFVIQCEPADLGEREVGGLLAVAAKTITMEDRSYMREPSRIVAVEMPFLVIEPALGRGPYDRRSMVDSRRYKMRVLSPEFARAWMEGQSAR